MVILKRVFKPKKRIKDQQYDSYWKLTVEYSDIFGMQFNNTLKLIVNFIDKKDAANEDNFQMNDSVAYRKIQGIIYDVYPKSDLASVRKSINQFIKLGFIQPFFKGYHRKTKEFLNCPDNNKKKNIFSLIFYESASFSSSFKNNKTKKTEVNFLLKTLMYHPEKKLTKNDLIALMVTNANEFSKGYLTVDELASQFEFSKYINFEEKKYNQISYLIYFLNLMPDLIANKDTGIQFRSNNDITIKLDTQRDSYRFSLYKDDLKNESITLFGDVVCYIDKKQYKGLIASHIKPSKVCLSENKVDEAYDYNNGLLLQPNIDAYFDKFDISFDEKGKILINPFINIDKENLEYLQTIQLDSNLLTEGRLYYLNYHRNEFYQKSKKVSN